MTNPILVNLVLFVPLWLLPCLYVLSDLLQQGAGFGFLLCQ